NQPTITTSSPSKQRVFIYRKLCILIYQKLSTLILQKLYYHFTDYGLLIGFKFHKCVSYLGKNNTAIYTVYTLIAHYKILAHLIKTLNIYDIVKLTFSWPDIS